MFRAGNAVGEVLRADQAPLQIDRIAVGIVGRLPEDSGVAGGGIILQHAVVRNIRENDEILQG